MFAYIVLDPSLRETTKKMVDGGVLKILNKDLLKNVSYLKEQNKLSDS